MFGLSTELITKPRRDSCAEVSSVSNRISLRWPIYLLINQTLVG